MFQRGLLCSCPHVVFFCFIFFFIFLFFNPCWEVPASCTPVLSDCGLQPAPTKRKLDWAPSPHTSGGFGSLFLAPPMAFSGGGAGAGPEPRAGRVYFCTWGTRWEQHAAAASCSHFCSPLFSQPPSALRGLPAFWGPRSPPPVVSGRGKPPRPAPGAEHKGLGGRWEQGGSTAPPSWC